MVSAFSGLMLLQLAFPHASDKLLSCRKRRKLKACALVERLVLSWYHRLYARVTFSFSS